MDLAGRLFKGWGNRAHAVAWALGLVAFLFIARVDATNGGPSGLEAIRVQMDKGQALFLSGKYEEAAEVFEQGYQAYPYSAFLFNAGVCHQKVGKSEKALSSFRLYLEKDPKAPDADQVKERVGKLEAAVLAANPQNEEGDDEDGQGPREPSEETTTPPVPDETNATMKSLVVVETEPAGAPILIYRRVDPQARAFQEGAENSGWKLVAERKAPADFTLDVGKYHVVVDKFREFNRSETDIDVSPGHVHQFKANLSQGAFMAFLRVNSNVPGAYVFVDDEKKKVAWGRAPYGELIAPGPHSLIVEAPGFEPAQAQVELEAGEQKEIEVQLVRLGFGIVRVDANTPEISVFSKQNLLGTWKQGDVALEIKLPAGENELRITADGHKDLRTTVDIPRGQILPLRAHMIESYPRGTAWAQAIIAAGLIGASTYFALESDRIEDNLRAERAAGNLSAADSRIDQGYWYSIGADAGFVLGGLFTGLSVFNFVRDPHPDSSVRKGKRLEFENEREKLPTTTPTSTASTPKKESAR